MIEEHSFMDQYGYYQIGDLKTYSVYEVMDYYHKDPQPYTWVYNDKFFSQYDWTQEPTESLDELYAQRAKELREQYDYIVLYYSGGYDSTNMLRAFLDNGIYPDEICYFYSRHDTDSHQYYERINFTEKKLERLKQQYPKLKIRKLDYADIVCNWPNTIADQNLNMDPIYLQGGRLNVSRLALDVMYEYIDDWKQLLKDNRTLCTLHGVDHVQLRCAYDPNTKAISMFHNFNDLSVIGHLTPVRQMTNKPNRDTLEFFYWAPTNTCAKILIKQGQLTKQYFTKLTNGKLYRLFSSKYNDIVIKNYRNRKIGEAWLHLNTDHAFKQIIYPNIFKDGETFYNEKTDIAFWGNRDTWFFNTDLPGSKEHWAMYQSLYKEDKQHWKPFFNDQDMHQGPMKITSKDYTL
jgi:hypothetical protein